VHEDLLKRTPSVLAVCMLSLVALACADGGSSEDAPQRIGLITLDTLLGLAGLTADVDADGPRGRDLLLDSGAGARVLGMRCTFDGPHKERLTDGSQELLDGCRFYLRDAPRAVLGNGASLDVEGAPLAGEREQEIMSMFGALEQVVENLHSTEILDVDTQEALKALGYAR
jgi:hypothetical protein